MDKHTEREIARGLREGNRGAWLQLYEAYAEAVWKNVSRLMAHDSAAVADIVQETFLAAARSARNFDARRGSLWVWLWSIAARQAALYYRKRRREAQVSEARQWWAGLDGEKVAWIKGKAEPPLEVVQSRELATLVRSTLRELSPEHQAVLLAKYVDNEGVDGIAKRMNCSPVAIRSKLARARRSFQKAFRKTTR